MSKISSRCAKVAQKRRKCPKCGYYYTSHPALSREDNKTEICSECGVAEALESFYASELMLKTEYLYRRE